MLRDGHDHQHCCPPRRYTTSSLNCWCWCCLHHIRSLPPESLSRNRDSVSCSYLNEWSSAAVACLLPGSKCCAFRDAFLQTLVVTSDLWHQRCIFIHGQSLNHRGVSVGNSQNISSTWNIQANPSGCNNHDTFLSHWCSVLTCRNFSVRSLRAIMLQISELKQCQAKRDPITSFVLQVHHVQSLPQRAQCCDFIFFSNSLTEKA